MPKFDEFDKETSTKGYQSSLVKICKKAKAGFKRRKLVYISAVFITCFLAICLHYVKKRLAYEEITYAIPQSHLSVKLLAYIFPQFHPIPENDKIWGVNFTEWVNVRKVTQNVYGQETLRPSDEVGYYNLLDLETRKRQGQFLRESGFYGVVYHHYWFGWPVMDGVLKALLKDGEPHIPFMLSWANEPWTARWDGVDAGEVFIKQDYGGIKDWKRHFEWLLPYFKHPLYIRSSEGKVQFAIYEPSYMGTSIGPQMFAAWRQWAIEEGLGGIDIVETRIQHDPFDRPPADAINEFAFRTANTLDHTQFSRVKRVGKVYHRGTFVCWDNTPRHPKDGAANPFCHPNTFYYHLIEMLRRIKLDPNPINTDNFLFINALNEWGEGNVLEPSNLFGNGYGTAVRSALETSKRLDPWFYELKNAGLNLKKELQTNSHQKPNVCVLIRAFSGHYPENTPFNLAAMLRSLQKQSNNNWRALVFKTEIADYVDDLVEAISNTFDPRIQMIDVPSEILAKYDAKADIGYQATDWVIENLDKIDPLCTAGRYIIITDSDKTYDASTFEITAKDHGDIIGINFASRSTLLKQEKDYDWNERCSRFNRFEIRLCEASVFRGKEDNSSSLDIGALFINLDKFRKGGYKFSKLSETYPASQHVALINDLLTNQNWTWYQQLSTICHLLHGNTYTSCRTTGRFWVDSPIASEMGCHGLTDFYQKFGFDYMTQWDVNNLREDPFCLRYTKDAYLQRLQAK